MADEKEKKEKKEAKPKGEAKPKIPGADAKTKAKGEGKKSKGKGRDAGAAAGPTIAEAEPPARVPRIKEHYEKNVLPELVKRFSYKNPMQAPRLRKIVVNMGVGDALQNVKMLDTAAIELGAITGQ